VNAPLRRCGACGAPLVGRTRRARFCDAACRARAARRSVRLASRAEASEVTRGARNATCDVEWALTRAGRCLGCGEQLGEVRTGTRCCSQRCRMRVSRWRKRGQWPRAELLASAWGIQPRDLWRTPPDLFGQYDAVFEFGLIGHWEATRGADPRGLEGKPPETRRVMLKIAGLLARFD